MAAVRLAGGDGWSASDMICSHGPGDPSFEEIHGQTSISVVVAGSFQYRVGKSSDTLTSGSLLLGNQGQGFECGHDHGSGDRCVAFHFTTERFERLAFDAVGHRRGDPFAHSHVPPLRSLAPLAAAAAAAIVAGADALAWEALMIDLAGMALSTAGTSGRRPSPPLGAESRVTRTARLIEARPGAPHSLETLAALAGLSPFHYLRTFRRVTGVTPHQFVLRTRLREAAVRLTTGNERIIDVAFDSGFGDISNFNRTFRREFGSSPRSYRHERSFR